MTEVAAIKAALGLLHLPASVRFVRREPLPPGLDSLLKVAAGDEQTITELAALTERSPDIVRDAATFFIEQVLLSPQSNHYQVLGLTPEASVQDLRRNMALLMSWLHPDKDLAGDRAVLAARVTTAWSALRSPERRAAYDATLRSAPPPPSRSASGRASPKTSARTSASGSQKTTRPSHRASRPAHRPLTLYRDEHHSLLQRGFTFLRRILRGEPT